MNQPKKPTQYVTAVGMGLVLGSAVGIISGIIFNNIGLGIAFGAALGLIFGSVLGIQKDNKK
jgi:uncharacterized membrane protein